MKRHYIFAAFLSLTILTGCDNSASTSTPAASPKTETVEAVKYNYMTAEQLADAIRAKEDIAILDVQPKNKFDQQHIVNAIPTYAYPVKTDAEKAAVKEALGKISPDSKIVVVCPGGRSGATNTIDYFKELGVDNSRMIILEKGANAWPGDKLIDVTVKDGYNYISAESLAKAIRDKEDIAILDVQPKDKFDQQHIVDAIPTYAYPVKTDAEKEAVKEALTKISPDSKIVVVCPGGRSGATNTIDYFKELGVDNARMIILEKGANAWPADQLSDVTVKQ